MGVADTMRIAIDHDGTAMLHPSLYKDLMQSLRDAGHEVGIITGRSEETEYYDKRRLQKHGFEFDFFWTSAMMDEEEISMLEKIREGKLQFDRDTVCCHFKARLCEERGVDILIDDNADTIRLFQQNGNTLMLKSPTKDNMVVMKWGGHRLVYDD
jgi:glycerophosphoryl diester phosphodiesterase